MENIVRDQQQLIEKWLFKNKIITVYGARQVGKTTMVKSILQKHGNPNDYYDCDITMVRSTIENEDPV